VFEGFFIESYSLGHSSTSSCGGANVKRRDNKS